MVQAERVTSCSSPPYVNSPEPDDSTSTATVDVDGSVVGRIDSDGDRDWYAVQLDSAGAYYIAVSAAGSGIGAYTLSVSHV